MYDNVCKIMAEMFPEDFSDWLLGTSISLKELKPSELLIEPIRADSLIFLQADNLILHIEFQTSPEPEIPFRMADYRLRLYRRFPEKEVYQVVMYLKKTNSELVSQSIFNLRTMTHEFNVVKLWQESTEKFLTSPGLLPFAVLSKTNTPLTVLNQVAEVIDGISDRRVQSNITASTAILAGLSLNQQDIKRILRSDLMRESVIYQEILAEGEQKGEKKGEKKGEQRAREQVALNLLREGLTVEQIAKVTELSIEQVQALQIMNDVRESE